MAGRDERLVREALHELSRRELVRSARLSSMAGHAEYAFWHVLVRDVAYAEVPRAARGRKHRAAAEWLESQASERVEDVADVLAHHYLQALALDGGEGAERAELESRALRFLLAAGDRALGLDVAQAEAHYARALELAPPGHAEHLAALARRLEALRQAGRYAAALELVEEAVAAAGDGDADLPLLRLEQGWTLSVAGRVQQAVGALRAGLDAADGRRDGVVAQLLLQLARARTIQGEFEAGLEDALAAERIFAEHDDLRGLSRAARLAGDVYRKLGRWDDAAATLLRGLALAERVGSVEEVGGCLMNLSLVEHERGALDDAIEYCRKAVAEFERVGHGSGRAQGYANLAQLLADAGHDQEALLLCERSQRVARTIGHSLSIADTTDTMA
jgi:tetratricopeptide (TPR) repeat protein